MTIVDHNKGVIQAVGEGQSSREIQTTRVYQDVREIHGTRVRVERKVDMLIRLTGAFNGQTILVNPDNISLVDSGTREKADETGMSKEPVTIIHMLGEKLLVVESAEQIMSIIERARA